jgi:hypothetical protein
MSSRTKREERREQNRRKTLISRLIWGGVGVVVLAIIGFVVWQGVKPASGESFPIMVSSPHIEKDTDPGPYNSDPPTSGPHYPDEAETGFFDTNIYQYPAGYLVHNLEHGYIIFWYDCNQLSDSACTEPPAGMVPSAHETPIGPAVQDPCGVEVSTPVAPSGTCSFRTTFAAAIGPPFVTKMV